MQSAFREIHFALTGAENWRAPGYALKVTGSGCKRRRVGGAFLVDICTSASGRLSVFAKDRFAEAQFGNIGIGRAAATAKPGRLQRVVKCLFPFVAGQ